MRSRCCWCAPAALLMLAFLGPPLSAAPSGKGQNQGAGGIMGLLDDMLKLFPKFADRPGEFNRLERAFDELLGMLKHGHKHHHHHHGKMGKGMNIGKNNQGDGQKGNAGQQGDNKGGGQQANAGQGKNNKGQGAAGGKNQKGKMQNGMACMKDGKKGAGVGNKMGGNNQNKGLAGGNLGAKAGKKGPNQTAAKSGPGAAKSKSNPTQAKCKGASKGNGLASKQGMSKGHGSSVARAGGMQHHAGSSKGSMAHSMPKMPTMHAHGGGSQVKGHAGTHHVMTSRGAHSFMTAHHVGHQAGHSAMRRK